MSGKTHTVEFQPGSEDYDDLTSLWALRILFHTGIHKTFQARSRRNCPAIDAVLGFGPSDEPKSQDEWVSVLRTCLDTREDQKINSSGPVFDNVGRLGKLLGLNQIEQDIITFRALAVCSDVLAEVINTGWSLHVTDHVIVRVLSAALAIDQPSISTALRPGGILRESGLVKVDPGLSFFTDKISFISGLTNALLRVNESTNALFDFAAHITTPPKLSPDDYLHLRDEVELIEGHLKNAREAGQRGVNVLFYGIPGVGKTELAKVIAAKLRMQLYEVASEDWEGTPLKAQDRLDAFRVNQKILAGNETGLILFDEIEDVFRNPAGELSADKPAKGADKAWTNRMLEENPVPAFWIANRIDRMDPAFLRRFDYILQVRTPPRSVRRRVLEKYLKALPVREQWIERQASVRQLTPALVERAARVVTGVKCDDPEHLEKRLERMIKNTLEAQNSRLELGQHPSAENYSLSFVNPSLNLTQVTDAVRNHQKGKLLLYGPPGSGKTGYAYYLAKNIDKPLMVKRASDLVSMWVGETEHNIARMFVEASEDDAVLLLDEADSFLRDRSLARQSWEVTQVNELLTQMEVFEGTFICATNFMDNLDTAALRRFYYKIHFDYLSAPQRLDIFNETLQEFGVRNEEATMRVEVSSRLRNLSNLTAGDFSAIRNQWKAMNREVTPAALLDALQQESLLKPDGQKRAMGFVG